MDMSVFKQLIIHAKSAETSLFSSHMEAKFQMHLIFLDWLLTYPQLSCMLAFEIGAIFAINIV